MPFMPPDGNYWYMQLLVHETIRIIEHTFFHTRNGIVNSKSKEDDDL